MTRRRAVGLVGISLLATQFQFSCSARPEPLTSEEKANLHYRTLAEVAEWIRTQRITSEELTRLMLERIRLIDGKLNSYITLMEESALTQAKLMDKELSEGKYRGPLHGVPIGIKDLVCTIDAPTTMGHSFRANFMASRDATIVKKLKDSGAVILGKLSLTEGAMCGYSPTYRIPKNPWGEDLWTGVSSSGSGVATAAGLCFASIGSDTGGSIRFPSSANGVVGLKTTYGLVSKFGVLPLAKTFDSIGPMTRSVEDAAIMLEAIAAYDANDPTAIEAKPMSILPTLKAGAKGMRVGVDWDYIRKDSDPKLVAALEGVAKQLESIGATVVDFRMPEVPDVWGVITSRQAADAHKETFPSRKDEYGNFFADFLSAGVAVTDEQYQKALQIKEEFQSKFREAIAAVDAVIAPAGGMAKGMTELGWRGHVAESNLAKFGNELDLQYAGGSSLSGTPSLTLPCGVAEDGFPPPGFQLMGSAFSEAKLCQIGYAYEQSTDWHLQHPAV
ncbi:MAG: amidase, partial [Cyclobacteriaceae bacterium]|nr:amidase [Cyclobacteriaceae bacterium]